MGLKSGSRDAGLDDEEAASSDDATSGEPDADESAVNAKPTTDESESSTGTADPTPDESTTDAPERPSVESLPYVLRRDRVNEGRDQVPFFLREEVLDGERELRETLEAELGEDVYKSDYREAAMVVAQEHPELVAAVLRRWGYDL